MHFKMSSGICFNLDKSKILSSGKWVKIFLCDLEDNLNIKIVCSEDFQK